MTLINPETCYDEKFLIPTSDIIQRFTKFNYVPLLEELNGLRNSSSDSGEGYKDL